LLYFGPNWNRSYDRSKINKQECGLVRKGHGNGINEKYFNVLQHQIIKLIFNIDNTRFHLSKPFSIFNVMSKKCNGYVIINST